MYSKLQNIMLMENRILYMKLYEYKYIFAQNTFENVMINYFKNLQNITDHFSDLL